jgi:hypothetical protein
MLSSREEGKSSRDLSAGELFHQIGCVSSRAACWYRSMSFLSPVAQPIDLRNCSAAKNFTAIRTCAIPQLKTVSYCRAGSRIVAPIARTVAQAQISRWRGQEKHASSRWRTALAGEEVQPHGDTAMHTGWRLPRQFCTRWGKGRILYRWEKTDGQNHR